MNFYKRYMGDYARKTAHLSLTERGAYDALLDHYYATRRALPREPAELCRIARAMTRIETEAVSKIVAGFFTNGEHDELLHNKRADQEIAMWEAQAVINRRTGKLGGKRKGTEPVSEPVTESGSEPKPNQEPNANPLQKLEVRSQKLEVKSQKVEVPSLGLSTSVWDAYSSAYLLRWQVTPKRNATVNGQIKALVASLGADAVPIAAFYLSHNDRYYVQKRHPVGLLLKDAEGLFQQWKTGTKSTALEARSAEQRDAVTEQIKRVSAKLEPKP